MPESFPKADLGFVYEQRGLKYFSMISNSNAVDYWFFIESQGCALKEICNIETDQDLKYFLSREKEYREKVWRKLGQGKNRFLH